MGNMVFPGQMTIFDVLARHLAEVERSELVYDVDGEPRRLTWEKHRCSCGDLACTLPWTGAGA